MDLRQVKTENKQCTCKLWIEVLFCCSIEKHKTVYMYSFQCGKGVVGSKKKCFF